MKPKMKIAHMRAAFAYSQVSYCERSKVGCIIVRDLPDGTDTVVSIGYNGTPPGEPNVCETEDNVTKSNVIHAEFNALKKLNFQANGLMLFCTYAPCIDCAQHIIDAGITHVFYNRLYRLPDGLKHLKNNGILVEQVSI